MIAIEFKALFKKIGISESIWLHSTVDQETDATGYVQCSPWLQYIGLEDKNGQRYFIGDKGRFNNGDSFIIKMEDWLQPYIEWIGEPECEDQARDLYRISNAEITGTIHDKQGE